MTKGVQTALRKSFTWGERTFRYDLLLEDRRDLTISVLPDLRVTVRAPRGKSMTLIEGRVHARRPWIARQLRELERYHPLPLPRRFIAGETHWYLGRQYRLTIRAGETSVVAFAGRIVVTVPRPDEPPQIKRALEQWYAGRARAVFESRLADVQKTVPSLRRLEVTMRVRRMTRRWGSCAPSGLVTLNSELIRAPKTCIDYVVVHELCHLVVPSHSSKFYRLLRRCMPDWESRRQALNGTAR